MSGRVVLRELVCQVGGSFGEPADAMFSRLAEDLPERIDWSHTDSVAATREEHGAWLLATRRFQETVTVTERERAAAQTSPRNRFLPGGTRRRAEAAERCHAELRAAVRAYQPVIAEIERRRLAERAERRRRQEELAGRWRERAEREQRQRREQARLHLTVAAQAVWGWTLTERGGERTVWVHRYDVPPAARPGDAVRSSREPLTAAALERKLKALAKEARPGRLGCRWDERATMRVARECAVGDLAGNFALWWAAVTHSYWDSPSEIPDRRSERPSRIPPTGRGASRPSGQGAGGAPYGGGFSFGGGF
ncbi:hypothetical protein ACIQNG_24530 [Streptomyces sp. NPDC091377]|uniref:hypothetical protein n=1 Tax=Streptomyces sp. NPDC091377 TaxID=3365995 RepID=UPI00382D6AD1